MPEELHAGSTRPLVRRNAAGTGHRTALSSDPAYSAKAVTPNNGVDLPDGACRALWVGNGGDIRLVAADDDPTNAADDQLFENVPDGYLLPVACIRVHATDTTATGILALY